MSRTMEAPSSGEATGLLLAWSRGDRGALDKLLPLLHDELYRLAARFMRRERANHTLQPTALVNEAYLRLVDQRTVRWQNRAHFFAIAAELMRRILIDHARKQRYAKRGGGAAHALLDEAIVLSDERAAELVALDEALDALAAVDARQSRVVALRFFGGLTVEETAEVLELSRDMVKREWSTAKAWLYREMSNRQPQ
jgi:RNA polymerase sigma-70 factor, ECF subfamily